MFGIVFKERYLSEINAHTHKKKFKVDVKYDMMNKTPQQQWMH